MTYQTIAYDFPEKAIAIIRLNRPACANALNAQMALELKYVLAHLDMQAVRAVILTGQGRHFCAGADLKERKNMTEADWHNQHNALEGALQAVLHCPVPIIAAVGGAAFGGGLELAMACDFIYASVTARFALTEATLGIMPGLGGTQQLPRAIGMARARELTFTGKPFTAEEACAWGLVNSVFTAEALQQEALSTARCIAENSPLAVKSIKLAMKEGDSRPLAEALVQELKHYNVLLCSKDRHEGINAFNEKRKPKFSGE